RAVRLARARVRPGGGVASLHSQPEERGRELFARRCLECHVLDAQGTSKGPRLDGYLSKAWLVGAVRDPSAPDYFGNTKVTGMDGYGHLCEDKRSSLRDFLVAL